MALTPHRRLRDEMIFLLLIVWVAQLSDFLVPVLCGAFAYANGGWWAVVWGFGLYAAFEFIYLAWVARRRVKRLGAELAEANQRDNGE